MGQEGQQGLGRGVGEWLLEVRGRGDVSKPGQT